MKADLTAAPPTAAAGQTADIAALTALVADLILRVAALEGVSGYLVIHPLDDAPERKVDTEGLGPMKMTLGVRTALYSLRVFLILIIARVFYHVIGLAITTSTRTSSCPRLSRAGTSTG